MDHIQTSKYPSSLLARNHIQGEVRFYLNALDLTRSNDLGYTHRVVRSRGLLAGDLGQTTLVPSKQVQVQATELVRFVSTQHTMLAVLRL